MTRARTARSLAFAALVLLLGGASFYAGTLALRRAPAAQFHPVTHRRIAGIATDASWMDRAAREQEEAPERALALIGIHTGMVVADVGAGSGYMTTRIAALVGPVGHVYANDIQPGLLRVLQQKAAAQHLTNVDIVLGTDISANLPEGAIDLALLVDVYHELQHPQEMLRSIRRSLKPTGRLVLVEYRKEDARIPIAETHRLSVADARAEVEPEGFSLLQVIPDLPRQHIIVFRKSG